MALSVPSSDHAPRAGSTTIHGIASTATAELLVDGISAGVQPAAGSTVSWTLTPPASCGWPVNFSGVQCENLESYPAASSAEACAAAACAAGVVVWQWTPTRGCWAGTPSAFPCPPPKVPNPWVGGGRAAWAPAHNATLLGRNASGAVVASHTVFTPSPLGAPPAALELSLDVPSLATGTGERLLLDGQVRLGALGLAGGVMVGVTLSRCKIVRTPARPRTSLFFA